MEEGALEHHVACGLVGAAAFASEDAGDAHRLLFVADGEVVGTEDVLHAVEGDEFRSFWLWLDDDVMTDDHVGVEGVEGLAVCHHDIVGDVDDVVDGAQSDGGEVVFQPFRRLLHLASGDADAGVAAACLGVLDGHLDGQRVVVDGELVA